MTKNLRLNIMTSAILVAIAQMSTAFAEDAAPVAEAPVAAETTAADSTPLNLDKIVVTGTANKISKMKSSVSISTLNAEQIKSTGATNAAEVLRSIPGIRSESSGGEGNANMTVRGLPISAGGSRYLQMQEDGLPLLQFGDIAFSTPDMFMRVDNSLDKLEVVRGGSGSTLATNSPGGIINFISNTGEVKGGKIGVSAGLNFSEWRTDLSYGGPINDSGLRGFVSGFFRQGDGFRDANTTLEKGGQIKANITQAFDNGYIRASFKHLDDTTPTNLPLPSKTDASGNISEVGISHSDGTLYDRSFPADVTRGHNNQIVTTNVRDGLSVKTDSIGLEGAFDFDGWNISDKFRYANNDGRFIGIFPYTPVAANGDFTVAVFNTAMNDMNNTINDAKISKAFDVGTAGKITPTVGLYTSWQNVGLTWSFNSYALNINNKVATFTLPSTGTFGGCCTRDIDAEYRTISPYAALAWEIDNWNLDASIRHDDQKATGSYATATAASGGLFDPATRKKIDYNKGHTSYSVGANYRFNPNVALFGRVSNGVAFNADRIMFGSANLNGGVIPINEVQQYEAGIKWREGNLSTFVTLFKAKTDESNFDATTQVSTSNKYNAQGIEFESGYAIGDFRIGAGLTYTDAEISNAKPGTDRTVPRQAKLVYQFTPSYRIMDNLNVNASIIGTTASVDSGTVKMPGYAIVNAAVNYDYTKQWHFSLSANNLFDTIGYTEAQSNVARSVDGRSIRAAAVFSF